MFLTLYLLGLCCGIATMPSFKSYRKRWALLKNKYERRGYYNVYNDDWYQYNVFGQRIRYDSYMLRTPYGILFYSCIWPITLSMLMVYYMVYCPIRNLGIPKIFSDPGELIAERYHNMKIISDKKAEGHNKSLDQVQDEVRNILKD